jgi:hypothetical protein
MKFININFQFFREFCRGEQFNICHHPGNNKRNTLHSCCYTYCPVVAETRRQGLMQKLFKEQLQIKLTTVIEQLKTTDYPPSNLLSSINELIKLLQQCQF